MIGPRNMVDSGIFCCWSILAQLMEKVLPKTRVPTDLGGFRLVQTHSGAAALAFHMMPSLVDWSLKHSIIAQQ